MRGLPRASGLTELWRPELWREHRPRHATRPHHPDRVERLEPLFEALARRGRALQRAAPVPLESLQPWMSEAELSRLRQAQGRSLVFDEDTSTSPNSLALALSNLGAVDAALNAITEGPVQRAFVLSRPPGHHAGPGGPMGFCLLNHLALGLARWRGRIGRTEAKIAIIDWDVHHGNGTADFFARDPNCLVIDLHQRGHWPGSGGVEERGEGAGYGRTVNIEIPTGSRGALARMAFDRVVQPLVKDFRPEIIAVAAGYDADARDPLGELRFDPFDFWYLARQVAGLAQECCGGRILATLEGGYVGDAVAEGVLATLDAWEGLPALAEPQGAHEGPDLATWGAEMNAAVEAARRALESSSILDEKVRRDS